MSPSTSAADRFDDNPPPHVDYSVEEFTDSDIHKKEEDPEQEEELEMEEDDDVEEEEEEEGDNVEQEEEEGDDFEEEEEDEEEVEVEVEEEGEEDGEDLAMEADEDPKDPSQDMKSEWHDGQLRSGSCSYAKSESSLPSNALSIEDSSERFKCVVPSTDLLTTQNEESCQNYEDSKYLNSQNDLVTADNENQESVVDKDAGAHPKYKTPLGSSELHSDSKAYLCNSDDVSAETTNQKCLTEKEVAIEIPAGDCFGEKVNGVLNSKGKIKQMDMQLGEDKKQMAERLASPEIRPRSLSPRPEMKDVKKRLAVICEFFARGWCIKGSSCRFLHVKDHVNNTSQPPEGDLAAANWKDELQLDEGLRDNSERSRLPGLPDHSQASLVKNETDFSSPFPSERILPWEHGDSLRRNKISDKRKFSMLQREDVSLGISPDSQRSPASKVDSGCFPSSKDVALESLRQNLPVDELRNYALLINRGSSPTFKNSLLPDYGSYLSGSILSSSTYQSRTPSSHVILNLQSNSSIPPTEMLPSDCISARTGSSLSFSSSSLNASFSAQKFLGSDTECHVSRSTSLLRSSSPFSAPEPENLPPTNASADSLRSAELKRKFSSNDWEPSVPFQPSFFIPPTSVSSPGSLYDPLRDSIEQPNLGDGSYRVSILTGTLGAESKDVKHSISFDDTFGENVDKNCYTHGKDSLTHGAEIAGASDVDQQSGTMPKEENPSGPANFEDTSKTVKADIDSGSKHQSDGARHRKDLKVDRVRQNNEMTVEHKRVVDVQKESKASRHFRVALIDMVKELLKSTWHEGRLSKDAHNMIVKKAVDKVLSTLQPHQIPTTMELVKQYLSSSRPKIGKLVEGYVERYGKS